MAQVSYGTITVSDLTDITDVFLQYAKAIDSATITNNYAFSQTGEIGWYTLTLDTSIVADKYYFELINNEYKIVSNPTGNPATHRWYESSVYPTWTSGYQIWIRQVTIKDGIDVPDYGTPYLDTAVNQINNSIDSFDTRFNHFWKNLNDRIHGQTYKGVEWTKPDYLKGTYTASGIDNITFDTEDSSTYGYNTFYGNGLKLRYNAANMATLDGSALTFYQPPIISGNTVTPGNPTMKLSGNALIFYNPTDGVTAAATLDSTGLNISNGTIDLTSSETDRVHLSTRNLSEAATINGESTVDWRLILGDKFGVTKAGYISAASGKIGGLVLEQNSIHSNGKTLNNNVAGTYIDSLGQFNTGDGVNYIKSWKDSSDNRWKISLRASEMLFSSGANVEDELITAKSDAETAKTSIDKEINGYLSVIVESNVYEESAIEIDAEKYGSSFGAGTNTFTYTNNHWYLNGSLVTEEDFLNYGMTIKQTPVEGDSFNVIATNVESLSSSLTNLREEVNSNSNSISNLIDHAENNTSSISALSEKSSVTTATVDDLTSQVQELSNTLYGEKAEREARMTFGTNSEGDPILTLGGGAHSEFQVDLTNLKLEFKEKNYTVAFISGHVLTIENANVLSQLQMDNFAWIPRKNGHLTLKYMG